MDVGLTLQLVPESATIIHQLVRLPLPLHLPPQLNIRRNS